MGLGGIALVGREASGGSAVGALTAVEDLGQVATVVSALSQGARAERDLLSHKVLELALALRLGAFQDATRVLDLYDIAQSGAV